MPGLIIGVDSGLHGAIAVLLDGQVVQIDDMPTDKMELTRKGKPTVVDRVSPHRLAQLLKPFADNTDFNPFKLLCEMPTYRPIVTRDHRTGIRKTIPAPTFSVATIAENIGMLRMAAAAYNIPFHGVAPNSWKARIRAPADKEACRTMAMQVFPAWVAMLSRKKDEGRAEACLIAYYGWTTQTSAAVPLEE
jgi:crossover junction endodeoxyribonuclease RuvC